MDTAPGNEIKVAIRVRPLLPKEQTSGLKSRWHCTETMISPDSSQTSNCSYIFDRVFDENTSNMMVYKELASDIVKQAMIGFHGTLFTYGQSGSGKTYTIDALRTFAIKSAYDYIENCPAREFLMRVSYIELYNEKLMDLLSDDSPTLTIREDNERNVYIDGLKEEIVTSQDHVQSVLKRGNARRTFGETKLNDRSSRAHCIFRLVIESRERDDPEHSSVYVSNLNLVDLAGSERAGENSGDRLREGVSINLSLLTLSQVIRKLSGDQREFISYRDSKLTRILQNALEGNSKTAILCTVAPFSVEETHSTLKFALNAKKVKTKPQQNEVLTSSAMLKKSQSEITILKNKIRELEGRNLTQETEELQRQREKWEHLIKEFGSFLCVSSKANDEKRFEKKRRETVCVPQIYRTTDIKAPSIIPKVNFFNSHPKQVDRIYFPESPPLNNSVFELAVQHPVDSPCASQSCSCSDMSFTELEQTIVQKDVVEKYKSKLKICESQIEELNRKLRQKSGLFVTSRRKYTPSSSFGPEFQTSDFEEENFETMEVLGKKNKSVLNEEMENTYVENETLKSQISACNEEMESVKVRLEELTSRVTEQDKMREESEITIAKLHDKINKDKEEMLLLKATNEELVLCYEKERKEWNEKFEKMEWDKNMLEMIHEEKGLLDASCVGKLETVQSDQGEILTRQKEELLIEWEQMRKFKEELNEQVKSVESQLSFLENEKGSLNEEKDRIHIEWNNLEKANDDLRQEKEEFTKQQESVESMIERLHILQDENEQLRCSQITVNDVQKERLDSVQDKSGQGSDTNDQQENVEETDMVDIVGIDNRILQEWKNLKHAEEIFKLQKEAFEREKLESRNIDSKLEKLEKVGNETSERLLNEQEEMQQFHEQKDIQKAHLNLSANINPCKEEIVENNIRKCGLVEERSTLLKELEYLKQCVFELNRRKEVLESEMSNFHLRDYADGSAEYLLKTTDSLEGRLQEEWEVLKKAQNELKTRETDLDNQEALFESKLDKCDVLEEEIKRLQEDIKQFREADKRREKETVVEDKTVRDVDDAHTTEERAEENFDLERQKVILQTERDTLQKYRSELAKQEENVEQKIERLCMLEEEKEQLEEEKNRFERELENLSLAKKDFMKEQEIFRQKVGENQNNLEQEKREVIEINALKEEKPQKDCLELIDMLRQEKEVLEQKQTEYQERELLLNSDQEIVTKEQHTLTRNLNASIIDKKTLELKMVKFEENKLNGKESIGKTEELHYDGTLSHTRDDSGIASETSRGNTTLNCEGKNSSTISEENCKVKGNNEENTTVSCEVIECSKILSLSIHGRELEAYEDNEKLQKKSETQDRDTEKLLIEDFEKERKILLNIEAVQIFEEKQRLQNNMENLKEAEENLRLEQEFIRSEIERLHTLQEENDRLQSEKDKLCNEKMGFQKEKEKFQKEKEILHRKMECLEREIYMHREEKDGLQGEKENLQERFEGLINAEDDLLSKKRRFLCEDEKEELCTRVGKMEILKEADTLKQDKSNVCEVKASQTKEETSQTKEEASQTKEEASQTEEEASQTKEEASQTEEKASQTEDEASQTEDEECFEEETQKLQHELENMKLCYLCLKQVDVIFCEDKKLVEDEKTKKELVNVCKNEQDMEEGHLNQQEDIELEAGSNKQSATKFNETHLNKQESLKEMIFMDFSQAKDNIAREREMCGYEKTSSENGVQSCDLVPNAQISCFSVNGKENDKLEETERQGEEWGKLKLAWENVVREQTVLRELEEDIKMRLEKLEMSEEEHKKLQQRAQEQLKRNQDQLKEWEDNIQQEVGRLHSLENEKEKLYKDKSVFDTEIDNLANEKEMLEDKKTVLQKENDRLEKEKEMLEEKKTVFQEGIDRHEKEKEMLEEKKKIFQKESDRLEKEKEMLEDKKTVFQEGIDRLEKEKEMLEEKKTFLQKESDRLEKEKEVLEEKKTVLQKESDRLEKEKEMYEDKKTVFQEGIDRLEKEKEMLEEKKTVFQEGIDRLEKEKEMLEEKKTVLQKESDRLEKEKEILEEKKTVFLKENDRLEKEMYEEKKTGFQEEKDRLEKEKEMLEEKKTVFQKENDRLEKEKEMLEDKKTVFQKESIRLEKEKEMLEDKKTGFQEEKDRLEKEKEMLEEKKTVFLKESNRLEKEKEMYEEKKTDFQEEKHTLEKKKAKCESEKETLREMKNVIQKNQEKLCKDRECLEEQQTIIQKEYEKYQKDVEILKEDKVGLQVEKDRLENVEKSIQEKFDSLQIVNVRLAKNREELNEKERSIESRIEKACILEEERKKFQNEWEMLKKTQDILLKKMALLDKRESRLEDDNRQLQKELENIQCSQEDIKKNSVVLLEKERIIKDERAELETAWESLRQSQDDLKKEQDAMKQKCEEIDEKMKTVGESDRNTHGGDRGQDVSDTESPELLKEQLQNLEDELDCMTVDLEGANEKIKTLEYFITKGKALLAENTYSINQANNRIKELEENLVLSTAKLEATNEECEKLKKIQQNSRVAALEQDGLRKELEKKMRAGDTDYYEDVIRQLKLKLRDVQSNEASFYEPKDSSSKCTPSIDQMRKIIEFENASKFLELSDLRKRVAEQKTEISNLEAEKSQLQAQCNTLQLHIDNETLKSETMKSTANQATCARIKCEAELTKLKRELGKDRNQVQDVSSDEATKMLKNQLKEKDSLINELNRTIDTRNMQWNGIALRNKQLIEQNHSKQKLESELQVVSAELAKLRIECSDLEKFRKDSAELTRLRQEIAENKTFKHSTSTQLLTLQKENTELKASLEKLKSEVQVAPKDSYLKHLQGQENLQLPQEELQHHSSTNMSGGAIASYVIVVKEREIRDLKKKIHMQSELLKQLGKNINSGSEEHDYRRSLDNSIDKENQTPHH